MPEEPETSRELAARLLRLDRAGRALADRSSAGPAAVAEIEDALQQLLETLGAADPEAAGAVRLRSSLPVPVRIFYLDRPAVSGPEPGWVEEDGIDCGPVDAFWRGMKEHGWPGLSAAPGLCAQPLATSGPPSAPGAYSVAGLAVIRKGRAALVINLGYHLSAVVASCGDGADGDCVLFRHAGGGAPGVRRARRVRLIADLLADLGFVSTVRDDLLHAVLTGAGAPALEDALRKLGRIVLATKQLDMALSSDALTEWYAEDIRRRIGLGGAA